MTFGVALNPPMAQRGGLGAPEHLGKGLVLHTATSPARGPVPAGVRKLAGRKRPKRLICPRLIKSCFKDPGCGQKD